jgi:alkylation response protein AidB-like acyl-CoA dehydrogenase
MSDQKTVEALTEELLRDHDPSDRVAFRGAQYDLGLGWVHFPVGYGGLGADPKLQRIVETRLREEKISYEEIGWNGFGMFLAAPTIVNHASPETRSRLLRPLFTGEEIWCQLFSEPGAGSDLASLTTRAVRDGDDWVVTGQKVWTSLAHFSRYGILLARTDPDAPKHAGISYFVCPMDLPGIEVRPLVEMTGEHMFNEVFPDEVRLPAENLVGAEHGGWALAKVTLANERVSLSSGGALWGRGPSAEDLLDVIRKAGGVADPLLRQRLARLWTEATVLRLIRLRTLTSAVRGEPPGPEASVRKLLADEHGQQVMALAKDLAGAAGMLAQSGPLGGPDEWGWSYGFLFAPALTIGGGTTQVQRNILAERVLGLPHDL